MAYTDTLIEKRLGIGPCASIIPCSDPSHCTTFLLTEFQMDGTRRLGYPMAIGLETESLGFPENYPHSM